MATCSRNGFLVNPCRLLSLTYPANMDNIGESIGIDVDLINELSGDSTPYKPDTSAARLQPPLELAPLGYVRLELVYSPMFDRLRTEAHLFVHATYLSHRNEEKFSPVAGIWNSLETSWLDEVSAEWSKPGIGVWSEEEEMAPTPSKKNKVTSESKRFHRVSNAEKNRAESQTFDECLKPSRSLPWHQYKNQPGRSQRGRLETNLSSPGGVLLRLSPVHLVAAMPSKLQALCLKALPRPDLETYFW
ncbi:unnamed protein product [Protopolystoma xenopodis]|uniref:Uncharacterized protein n=1 Tax=Protopolystoma xenopodis TaxID=117903 RepID=A0A448WKP8_9PLAT|nr:unnamed protein product [Protopolystoma xenopodis]